jgi:hypothetical protein
MRVFYTMEKPFVLALTYFRDPLPEDYRWR